jgi:hypothetical protein
MQNFFRVTTLAVLITLAACGGNSTTSPPLSVSGTVTGLTASGLVLTDGFNRVTVASGAASFSFGASLTTGDTYVVTVKTQPTNQICSVANGSGDLTTANVTNVVVTCTNQDFQLGGTVSGLNAPGLVLANGSGTVAVASGATGFTFGASLTRGMSYAVTVKTQPTVQFCSVANGNGTVATANVVNVVVTCAARVFSVGGTVSGLTVAGLVLANGSDTVAVPAHAATFTLPTPVAIGSSYHVTVHAQPAGLACAATGGSGTMPAHDVATVIVSCTDEPFTLGGTISGLTTSGLVLANGSDTLIVSANAASFTMPTTVNFGSAYTLTVQTQPTGLTCSFSTGGNVGVSAGTMPASDVSNVALVCSPQSFALGGTVSGLSSGTLVLANGTDMLSVTANGAFQMPSPVAYGSTYTITVATQPTGLTCTVGNATNSMPASAVTNVTVTCAVNSYTIGGTISGLSTTGLVLQDNGTDNLSVAANAAQFSMPTAVASGGTYSITILTQPTGQTCTVTNGSGPVTGAVANVQITCPPVVSFTAVGAESWTVPSGVTSITVTAYAGGGAGGGPATDSSGGSGAEVISTMTVQPGDSVTVYVGAGGATGTEGGGGGGLTYVGDGASNFVIAGGGGGGGSGPGTSGNGGNAGSPGGNGIVGTGGAAGNNGAGGAAGTGPITAPYGETAGNAFVDVVSNGSGSGGGGGGYGAAGGGAGGAGISSGIGNGGNGAFGYGAGGGGGGYGGGGGGGIGGNGTSSPFGSGGGGGGGSTGPTGTTTITVAPLGGPGAGGTGHAAGAPGAVTISHP